LQRVSKLAASANQPPPLLLVDPEPVELELELDEVVMLKPIVQTCLNWGDAPEMSDTVLAQSVGSTTALSVALPMQVWTHPPFASPTNAVFSAAMPLNPGQFFIPPQVRAPQS